MKKFSEQVTVRRELVEITMSELRKKPGEICTLAELGKVFVITKCGKPKLVLSKVPGEGLSQSVDSGGKVKFKLES